MPQPDNMLPGGKFPTSLCPEPCIQALSPAFKSPASSTSGLGCSWMRHPQAMPEGHNSALMCATYLQYQ